MKNLSKKTAEFIPGIARLLPDNFEVLLEKISPIQIASTPEELSKVRHYLNSKYENFFSELANDDNDPYLNHSITAYTEDEDGNINSTASIALGDDQGLPDEHLFQARANLYRKSGVDPVQVGRFIIDENLDKSCLKSYMRLFYLYPLAMGRKVVFGLVRRKDVPIHEHRFGAEILIRDTQMNYGSNHTFAVAVWPLGALSDRLHKFIDLEKEAANSPYSGDDWDNYASVFASIQTPMQRELQQEASSQLYGDVADFGCGTAKIGILLSDSLNVNSYIGIDASAKMLEIANHALSQFEEKVPLKTWQGYIENYEGKPVDSAVSLNSYYSWGEPVKVLKKIYQLIKPGGKFVVATPSPNLDLHALDKEARKDLILHPDYPAFREHNLKLVDSRNGNFVTMNTLISQLISVGFNIDHCHSRFYHQGLLYVVAIK